MIKNIYLQENFYSVWADIIAKGLTTPSVGVSVSLGAWNDPHWFIPDNPHQVSV